MFFIMRQCSYILIVLVVVVDKTHGVSVRPEQDELELITASAVGKKQSSLDEKVTSISPPFNRAKIDKSTDYGRENDKETKNDAKVKEDNEYKGKKIRTVSEPFPGKDKFHNCCGRIFEASRQPESSPQFTTRVSEADRYQDRYGSQSDDRHGWQSSSGRPSGGSLYGNQGQPPNRYGSRPGHSSSGVNNEYGRPPIYIRPGGNRVGYGYEDSGNHGDKGGYDMNRPSGIYLSGSSRPGSYGIYGTFGEQDEFPDIAGDRPPQQPSNIHTQKAVALKALAGVALIGAAAALAANPVLLPVGALAGRKKRSAIDSLAPENLTFPYEFLREHVPGIEAEATAEKFLKMPECLARLTCEIQLHYITKMKDDEKLIRNAQILRQEFEKQIAQLITSEMLNSEWIRKGLQIHSQKIINEKFSKETCKIFQCNLYTS